MSTTCGRTGVRRSGTGSGVLGRTGDSRTCGDLTPRPGVDGLVGPGRKSIARARGCWRFGVPDEARGDSCICCCNAGTDGGECSGAPCTCQMRTAFVCGAVDLVRGSVAVGGKYGVGASGTDNDEAGASGNSSCRGIETRSGAHRAGAAVGTFAARNGSCGNCAVSEAGCTATAIGACTEGVGSGATDTALTGATARGGGD